MTHPSPRPALRKADDHAVHPAAPAEPATPAVPPATPPRVAPTPLPTPSPESRDRGRHGRRGGRRAGRATSDTLRPVPSLADDAVEQPSRGPKPKKGKKAGKGKGDKHKGKAAAAAPAAAAHPAGSVALVVAVDPGLAARLDARAAALGLRREQAVEQLLRAWVDG